MFLRKKLRRFTLLDNERLDNERCPAGFILYFTVTSFFFLISNFIFCQAIWQRVWGGTSGHDYAYSVIQCSDGSYAFTGWMDGYLSSPSDNALVGKWDAAGNQMWTKVYDATGNWNLPDWSHEIIQTTDGGYGVAGMGFYTGTPGSTNLYLLKLDPAGILSWSKVYGVAGLEQAYSLQQTNDGGFILAGTTIGFGQANNGFEDMYLVKTDGLGALQWAKCFGGTGTVAGQQVDTAYCVRQTTDGGYIAVGNTNSFGAGLNDVYLVKTDAAGNLQWAKTIGGANNDFGRSVQQTADGGFVIAGWTSSFGAGNSDAYLIKTDVNGNLLWTRTFGGAQSDDARSCRQTNDGGFILAGSTRSFGGGNSDFYLVKADSDGNHLWSKTYGASTGTGLDQGFCVQQTFDGGFIVSGRTRFYFNQSDPYLVKTDASGNTSLTCGIMGTAATQQGTGGLSSTGGLQSSQGTAGTPPTASMPLPVDSFCAPPTPPIANFSFSTACDSCRSFTDASIGSPTAWLWNFPGASPSSSTLANPTNICFSSSGTYSVTLQVTNGAGTDDTTLLITVSPPAVASISSQTNVSCNGGNNGTAAVSASGGSGSYTYSWNTVPVQTTSVATNLSAGNYTVTLIDSLGCTDTAVVSITEPPPILLNTVSTDDSCNTFTGTAGTTPSNGTAPYTYLWSNGSTQSAISNLPSGIYSVTVTDGSGCSKTDTVTVFSSGSFTATAGPSSTICTGQTITLTSSGGTNYSWSNGNTSATITVSPTATITYSVIVSTGVCADTASATITVSPPPVASASSSTICLGQTATLTATGGGTYLWSNGSTASAVSLTLTSSSTYSVIVSIGTCSDTASASITVNPNPVAAAYSNVTINSGQSITLGASGGVNYLWSNGSIGSGISVSPLTTTLYCVTVTNSFGCTDSACVTVAVEPTDCSFSATGELFIPNAFSPNEDGENERIKLLYGNYACIDTYKFIVYNRWGEKVFETENPLDEWDGTHRGRLEDSAVFAWYMKAVLITGEKIIKKGNISLLK